MKELLAKKGSEKRNATLKQYSESNVVLSEIDNTVNAQKENEITTQQPKPEPKHNTQAEIAKAAKVSTGKLGMAEVVRNRDPELWEKAKQGEVIGRLLDWAAWRWLSFS